MSTRAHIAIKNGTSELPYHLYHHCDGYPDGVGSDLSGLLSGYTGDWSPKSVTQYILENGEDYRTTHPEVSWDCEYVYIIDCTDHTLSGYSKGFDRDFDLESPGYDKVLIPDNQFQEPYHPNEVDNTTKPNMTLREIAAIHAMAATISLMDDPEAFNIVVDGFSGDNKTYPNEIAEFAVVCADALVKQLEKN